MWKPKLYHDSIYRPLALLSSRVCVSPVSYFTLMWQSDYQIQLDWSRCVLCVHICWIHCCVIFAASAFIKEMSSRFIRNTNLRPAICGDRCNWLAWALDLEERPSCTYLYHRVVVKFPLAARKNRPAVDVDGPPPLVGDKEVSVIFQFNNSCREKCTQPLLTNTEVAATNRCNK